MLTLNILFELFHVTNIIIIIIILIIVVCSTTPLLVCHIIIIIIIVIECLIYHRIPVTPLPALCMQALG